MSKAQPSTTSGTPAPLLTINDVAGLLQLSTRQVRRLIDAGNLRVLRIGRAVRVRPEDLWRFLDSS